MNGGPQHLVVHATLDASYANGPGRRCVIWLQGCKANCPGCFNQQIRSFSGGQQWSLERVLQWSTRTSALEGVTVTGGEPMLQAQALGALLRLLKEKLAWGTLIYSGWTVAEFMRAYYRYGFEGYLDAAIVGHYEALQSCGTGALSSSNQELLLFTQRYSEADFRIVPDCEIVVRTDGKVVKTGLRPV